MRVIAIVLAGGQGTRFWPKSSEYLPKQFLDLFGYGSLLQSTVRRLSLVLPQDSIYVSTNSAHEHLARLQLPQLPEENIIGEPVGRDTAAAVGYACTMLGDDEAESVAIVVPSDHHVNGEEEWAEALSDSCRMAESGTPVLVGVSPTRPETTYGYILLSDETGRKQGSTRFHKVAQFIEKPTRHLAQRLIGGKRCLWNSGMFVWKISTFRRLLAEKLPATAAALEEIGRMKTARGAPSPGSQEWRDRAATVLLRLKSISVDYGIMEKCPEALVALGGFRWDDVGNWDALARLAPADASGNVCLGEVLLHGSGGCIVDWPGGPAVVIGAQDLVVAGCDGKLLVCARDRLGEMKAALGRSRFAEIVEASNRPPRAPVPFGSTVVPKPWGRELWWSDTDRYAAKILEVEAGFASSLHYHHLKHETLFLQSGRGRLVLGDKSHEISPGSVHEVRPGVPHRIYAVTDLTILEVSTPDLDDVVRLADDYGRSQGEGAG